MENTNLEYLDYQRLLKEEFLKRKTKNQNFSIRSFARWLGISPAQLSQMMSGKRPMTSKTANKIAERLGLSPVEKVALLQSTNAEVAKEFQSMQHNMKSIQLKEDEFQLISEWYHFAILSLCKIKGAKADARFVAARLGISMREASEALERLKRMNIISSETNILKQLTDPIEVMSDVPSTAIRKYHKQHLTLAADKIDTVAMELRDFSTATMSINPKNMPAAKKLIAEFQKKISMLLEQGEPTEVYVFSHQLYPLSVGVIK